MIVEVHFFGTAKQFLQPIPPDVERDLPQVSLPEGTTLEDLLRILGVRSDSCSSTYKPQWTPPA